MLRRIATGSAGPCPPGGVLPLERVPRLPDLPGMGAPGGGSSRRRGETGGWRFFTRDGRRSGGRWGGGRGRGLGRLIWLGRRGVRAERIDGARRAPGIRRRGIRRRGVRGRGIRGGRRVRRSTRRHVPAGPRGQPRKARRQGHQRNASHRATGPRRHRGRPAHPRVRSRVRPTRPTCPLSLSTDPTPHAGSQAVQATCSRGPRLDLPPRRPARRAGARPPGPRCRRHPTTSSPDWWAEPGQAPAGHRRMNPDQSLRRSGHHRPCRRALLRSARHDPARYSPPLRGAAGADTRPIRRSAGATAGPVSRASSSLRARSRSRRSRCSSCRHCWASAEAAPRARARTRAGLVPSRAAPRRPRLRPPRPSRSTS